MYKTIPCLFMEHLVQYTACLPLHHTILTLELMQYILDQLIDLVFGKVNDSPTFIIRITLSMK